jgi:hypothetical protein
MTNTEIIRSIKKLAINMRDETSQNDPHHEKLGDISDLCDELIQRCTDDGK